MSLLKTGEKTKFHINKIVKTLLDFLAHHSICGIIIRERVKSNLLYNGVYEWGLYKYVLMFLMVLELLSKFMFRSL